MHDRHGTTPAALIVVTTLALVSLWLAAVTGLVYLRGELSASCSARASPGSSASARTGNSTPSSEPQPATVEQPVEKPIPTTDVLAPARFLEPAADVPKFDSALTCLHPPRTTAPPLTLITRWAGALFGPR